MYKNVGVRTKKGNCVGFRLDNNSQTCYIPIGCTELQFELDDVLSLSPYRIIKPKDGWKTEFTEQEKYKLRPIAETLAMLDGNAFFGTEIGDIEWYEMYLPEAHTLYEENGGDNGWAGETSFTKRIE